MTKEEFAATLDGRMYRSEMTKADEAAAKAAGLVVVFGASDDLIELRGAIDGEADCYDGGSVYVNAQGLVDDQREDCDGCAQRARAGGAEIEAVWCAADSPPWTYKTAIPHATFEIHEDGEPYCRGIVFNVADTERSKP